jgi:hypothetical protein
MKTLMLLAVLMAVAAILLGDVIMGIFAVVSLAYAGTDALVRRHPVTHPVQA